MCFIQISVIVSSDLEQTESCHLKSCIPFYCIKEQKATNMLINESESPLKTYKPFRIMIGNVIQTSMPIIQPMYLNLPLLSG